MSDKKVKVLVVDDVDINRIILQEILKDSYDIELASDGMEAVSLLFNSIEKPHLVLLDIMMPGMNGFEVLELMKSNPAFCKIPVIFITAANEEIKGLNAGAVDYISKPFEAEIVKLRVANQIELYLYREKLEGLVEQKAYELVATKETFLETMASVIEYRSLESGQHIKRTKELVKILVLHLLNTNQYAHELANTDYSTMIKAAPLHDLGKIGIPDNILLKPGKLTPEEFKVIETHTNIGGDVIKSMMLDRDDTYLQHCYDIARHHHERWDGTGYPDKMAGTDIPLSARIMAVADVYDALVSERCYKKAFTHEEAIKIITDSSETHFDPEIVKAVVDVQEKFRTWQ